MTEESSVSVIPVGSSISTTEHDSFHNASPSLNAIFLKSCQEVWHSCQPRLQAEDHYSTELLRTEHFLGKYIHSFAKIKDNGQSTSHNHGSHLITVHTADNLWWKNCEHQQHDLQPHCHQWQMLHQQFLLEPPQPKRQDLYPTEQLSKMA